MVIIMKLILILPVMFLATDFEVVKVFTGPEPVEVLQRPVRAFHGLGGECFKTSKAVPYRKCVETGNGFFGSTDNLYDQATKGCKLLEEEMFDKDGNITEKFKYGFHLEGKSQGGLIARLIFHTCPKVRPWVRRILTYGTPNLGVDKLPDHLPGQKLGIGLVKAFTTEESRKKNFSFMQYLNEEKEKSGQEEVKAERPYAKLIKELLSMVNVEIKTENDQVKIVGKKNLKIYNELEAMINIQFTEDRMVTPPSSSTFGMKFTKVGTEKGKFTDFDKAEMPDEVGLYELWSRGRMISCAIPADHLVFPKIQYTWDMFKFLQEKTQYAPNVNEEYSMKSVYDGFANRLKEIDLKVLECSFRPEENNGNSKPELI